MIALYITYAISSVIHLTSLFFIFNIVLGRRGSVKQLLPAYIVFFVVDYFIFYFNKISIIFTISTILMLFLLALAHSKVIWKNLVLVLCLFIAGASFELLAGGLAALFNQIFESLSDTTLTIFTILVSKSLHFIAATIFLHISKKKRTNLFPQIGISTILIPFLSILAMYAMLFSTNTIVRDFTLKDTIMFIIPSSLIIAINILVFYTNYKNQKMYDLQIRNDALNLTIEAQKTEALMEEEFRQKFNTEKHNYKNMLIGIQSNIEHQKYAEAINQIHEHIGYLSSGSHIITGFNILDSVLNYKIDAAQKYNISTQVTTQIETDINLKADDLSIVLGIAFDNAIEYLRLHTSVQPTVCVTIRTSKNLFVLDVANGIEDEIQIVDNKIKTTKESGSHGYGLISAEHIIKQYNGELYLSAQNSEFHFKAVFIM